MSTRTTVVAHEHQWPIDPQSGHGTLSFEGAYPTLRDLANRIEQAITNAQHTDPDADQIRLDVYRFGFKVTTWQTQEAVT